MKIGKIAAGLTAIALVAGVARNAKAQTPAEEPAAEDLREAEAVTARHRAELMKIPHVRVVTGEVDGQNEAAILVEVDDQKNLDAVMRKVPSQIEGFPVEVDEDDAASDTEHASSPPPTIDEQGIHRHTLIKPLAPTPDAQQ
jgi:hypothetical protein